MVLIAFIVGKEPKSPYERFGWENNVTLKKEISMKKLLLVAALTVAGGLQAAESCGTYVKCEGSVREGQTFKCPDCVCPRVECPIPPKTICKAVAQPIQETYCEQKKTCHVCHKPRVHGCKDHSCCRCKHAHVQEEAVAEKKPMRTPKRVQNGYRKAN